MKAKGRIPFPKYKNTLEGSYAGFLEALKLAGMIHSWSYEKHGFKLADGCYYYPDFEVVKNCGGIEFHETKARAGKGKRVQLGETKLKMAAKEFPQYVFKLVHKDGRGFKEKEISCSR